MGPPGAPGEARPDLAPGTPPTTRTMFAALYGEHTPHVWRGPEPDQDAYSLFVHHSTAMGWMDETGGLWSMNDGGWDDPLADREPKLVSWFQVDVEALAGDKQMPVQPFLHCAGEVTSRAGGIKLSAALILLPVQIMGRSEGARQWVLPAMSTLHWFGEGDPARRTHVEVCLDFGPDPSNLMVAEQLKSRLDSLHQEVFEYDYCAVGQAGAGISPPFDDSFWNGPPVQHVVFSGALVEWSLDAIGWLAEILASCVARLGCREPIIMSIKRQDHGSATP